MQVWMHGWSSNSFSDRGHQFAMMKNARIEFFLTWVLHLLMKRNLDSNWRFDPACGSVDLFILPVIFIRALALHLAVHQSVASYFLRHPRGEIPGAQRSS